MEMANCRGDRLPDGVGCQIGPAARGRPTARWGQLPRRPTARWGQLPDRASCQRKAGCNEGRPRREHGHGEDARAGNGHRQLLSAAVEGKWQTGDDRRFGPALGFRAHPPTARGCALRPAYRLRLACALRRAPRGQPASARALRSSARVRLPHFLHVGKKHGRPSHRVRCRSFACANLPSCR